MEFTRINSWLQVGANVGIVVGLLLVGVQLKQNSDLLKTQLLYQESQRQIELETMVVGENGAAVWAKSINEPGNLTLSEQRVMEALLWSFAEQLRATRMLAELDLLDDEEWRLRVDAETGFFLGNTYGTAWWANYKDGNNALPSDLRQAIDDRLVMAGPGFTMEYTKGTLDLVRDIIDSLD